MSEKNFAQYMVSEREKINRTLGKVFDEMLIVEDEAFLKRFYGLTRDFFLRGGRRVLSISAVNIFRGLASDKDIMNYLDEVYKAAVSLEFLRQSQIIVDDYMDNDELRYGFPAFHRHILQAFPENYIKNPEMAKEVGGSATVYGSFLTSFSGSEIIEKVNIPEERKKLASLAYFEGLSGINKGYLLDEYYRVLPLEQMTLENYLLLASLKRGKQMETAVAIGAYLANARQSQMLPLMAAMNKIGIIDQLINDFNGTFGDPTRKSTENDIRQGQRTILTTVAYQSANNEQKAILNKVLGNTKATSQEIESVKKVFQDTGAADFVKFYANSLKNDAYTQLQKVFPGLRKEISTYFEDLMTFIITQKG